ncbi:TPA: hypothetical protein PCJ90_001349 [Klebsiella quasipneumoniae]|nr:hypothetical protein [Klebsiella quasipneumoniae]
MGNFFGEIGNRIGDLVSHPIKMTKDTITNPSKGIKEWGDLYTHNEHKDQDLFQKGFGIHGWVGNHPQETAAAVVATVFGGWAAWGAYGAGAAGTATGATAGTTAGATGAGANAMAYTPTASSAFLGSSSATAGSTAGFGSSAAMTYAPTTSSAMVGSTTPTTAGLGISGSGVTSFPEVETYSQGTLGSGTGWLGGDAPMIQSGPGSSAKWADRLQQMQQGQQSGSKGSGYHFIKEDTDNNSPVTQVKGGEPQNNTALESPQINFSKPKFYNSWDDVSSFGGQF